MDLAEFLGARLDEDEAAWRARAEPGGYHWSWLETQMLREVEAKRAILALHEVHRKPSRWGDSHPDPAMRGQPTGRMSYWCNECDRDRDYGHIGGPDEGCPTLRHLAAVYRDHRGYQQEWAPTRATRDGN